MLWRNRRARAWLLALVSATVVLAVLAATGGLRRSDADTAPVAGPGEVLRLARWEVVVHGASVVNYPPGSPYGRPDSQLRVRADLTHLGEESADLPQGVSLRLPDGTVLATPLTSRLPPWSGAWDPDVTAAGVIDFDLPDSADWPRPAPGSAVLLLTDETRGSSFLEGGETWQLTGSPRWQIPLSTPDERVEPEPA